MIGSINDPRVLARIGAACGAAAGGVRERLTTAAHKEAEGQSGTREEAATEDVANAIEAIDALGDSLAERLHAESGTATADGKKVRIEFSTEKAPQGEENAFGLDLGVRVIIETPGYAAHKAILVQCKRMFGLGAGGTFTKLRDDGETQARDMLTITPASFFFLFNSGGAYDLFKMMRSPPYHFFHWFFDDGPWLPELYLDPGVTVLPAARVLAMSEGAKASGRPFPIGAAEVLAASVPLGQFIVDLFANCIVGDVRLPVLQLATPPARRKETTGGLDAPVPALGKLEPKRTFEFRFTKEGEAREKERPNKKPKG